MKDSEFIELLNLYVDHEITSADAARLEAEVAGSPERARIYRQYCGMQKACLILADRFRETAPAPEAGIAVPAEPRIRGWGLPFAATSLAAAACLGLVLLARHSAVPSGISASADPAQAVAPAARPIVAAAAPAPRDGGTEAVINLSRPQVFGERNDSGALLASSSQQDPFAWMYRVQLAPIQRAAVEPFIFDPKSNRGSRNSEFNGTEPLQQTPVEMTAFKLQLDK